MGSVIRSFRELDAWKVSMDLCVLSYELAKRLPSSERFEPSAQIRSAATSIPSNLAEGQAAGKTGRFLYHTSVALGSLGELDTELELARRLGMLAEHDLIRVTEQLARTGQLLHGLRRSLKQKLLTSVGTCLAFLLVLPFVYAILAALR